jgi:GH25 family lysozyme M1 (1,4-beta-N-acetylmuramidase)
MNDLYVPFIDTSAWQFAPDGTGVDWTVAARAGVRANVIRAGRGNHTGAHRCVSGVDQFLQQNASLSAQAGLEAAYYWRLDQLGVESADLQALRFLQAVDATSYTTSAPLILDIEAYEGPQLSRNAAVDWIMEFADTLGTRGHETAVYGNRSTLEALRLAGGADLIIAQWHRAGPENLPVTPPANARLWPGFAFSLSMGPTVPGTFGDWVAWQFTSAGDGKALGSSANVVDCDIMKANVFERWFGRA